MPDRKRSAPRVLTLPERIDRLNVKRQEIIRPILEHPREYVLLSVRALAQRLKTDPATVVRIVNGLGFGSYREFQQHLHELSLTYATSLDTMAGGERAGAKGEPAQESLYQDQKNLQALKNSMDAPRFTRLAKRIYAARRIQMIAGDLAACLAEYLGYQLNLLGLPIHIATSPGGISHSVRALGKRDLVFAISFRRGLRSTVEGAEQARAHGAYCVGIADTYLSPLTQHCHEVFLSSIHSVSFGASYSAPISLANAILTATGEYRRSRTMTIVHDLAEEQRKGSRWYAV